MSGGRRHTAGVLAVAAALLAAGPAVAAEGPSPQRADRQLDRALERLVSVPNGPPGAIAVVQRRDKRTVHRAGVAKLGGDAPRVGQRMRIASTSKALSGAAALALVEAGRLSLEDTIGDLLPDLPVAWHPVTLSHALHHTSGLPDFSGSDDFVAALLASPRKAPPPEELLGFVADQRLEFTPGARYEYSNSDNVVVGLMIEAVTGESYPSVLRHRVLRRASMGRTYLGGVPGVLRPAIRGYSFENGPPEDVTGTYDFGGWAWASGGVVSTPGNLRRFIQSYLNGRFFGGSTREAQFRFIDGAASEPAGPGRNAAGLALFRYRTRCGTVFGHTGSIYGYTQLIAASRNGRRSLTFSVNTQIPEELLGELRSAQAKAVCAALAR